MDFFDYLEKNSSAMNALAISAEIRVEGIY